MRNVSNQHFSLNIFIYLFIPVFTQTVRNWFPLGLCIHYKLSNNVKGTHRPKTQNEKYIGETYDRTLIFKTTIISWMLKR